jgi:hypothetical protein
MKRSVTLTATALLVTGVSGTATAQGLRAAALMGRAPVAGHAMSATTLTKGTGLAYARRATAAQEGRTIFGPPSFSLMLGGIAVNAVSDPEGADAPTGTGFMLRFQTTVPTAWSSLVGVAGIQWAVNGTDEAPDANAPNFFLGPVFLTPPEWTRGWLLVGLDALWLFSFGGGDRLDHPDEDPEDTNDNPFGSDLAIEFVVIVPFGSKMMPTMIAPFAGMSLVGLVSQVVTNRGEDGDYFNPALLAYLSLPIAPWSTTK